MSFVPFKVGDTALYKTKAFQSLNIPPSFRDDIGEIKEINLPYGCVKVYFPKNGKSTDIHPKWLRRPWFGLPAKPAGNEQPAEQDKPVSKLVAALFTDNAGVKTMDAAQKIVDRFVEACRAAKLPEAKFQTDKRTFIVSFKKELQEEKPCQSITLQPQEKPSQ